MKINVLTVFMLMSFMTSTQYSLHDKIAQATEKINKLRQNIKSGKDLENKSPSCSKCYGNLYNIRCYLVLQ